MEHINFTRGDELRDIRWVEDIPLRQSILWVRLSVIQIAGIERGYIVVRTRKLIYIQHNLALDWVFDASIRQFVHYVAG